MTDYLQGIHKEYEKISLLIQDYRAIQAAIHLRKVLEVEIKDKKDFIASLEEQMILIRQKLQSIT